MNILTFYQALSAKTKKLISAGSIVILVLLQGSLTMCLVTQKPLEYSLLAIFIIALVWLENGSQIKLQLQKKASLSHILLYFAGAIGVMLLLNQLFPASSNQKTVLEILSKTGFWGILHTCFIAPVLEEFIYRSQILSLIDHNSSPQHKAQCYVFAIVFFAGMHVTGAFVAFWQYLIPATLLVFGYAKYKGLATTIPLHIAINILAFMTA